MSVNTTQWMRRTSARYWIGSLLMLMGLALHAEITLADVIFDNGSEKSSGVFADRSTKNYFDEAADDFSLAPGQTTIGEIHWWGFYNLSPPAADDFVITIYGSLGTQPDHFPDKDSVIASINVLDFQRDITPATVNGVKPVFEYSAAITPVTLSPDTTHWLGISNATGQGWGFSAGQVDNLSLNAWMRPSPGEFFEPAGYDDGLEQVSYGLSFYLTDDIYDVPEPTTTTLLLVGCAALGFVGRRMRQT